MLCLSTFFSLDLQIIHNCVVPQQMDHFQNRYRILAQQSLVTRCFGGSTAAYFTLQFTMFLECYFANPGGQLKISLGTECWIAVVFTWFKIRVLNLLGKTLNDDLPNNRL